MALGATLVGNVGVNLDLDGSIDHLSEAHGAPLHDRGLMTGLASEPPMGAPGKLLERLLHEMAGDAEVIVVLDVIVGTIRGQTGHATSSGDAEYRQCK
jgi:hypothetical protein